MKMKFKLHAPVDEGGDGAASVDDMNTVVPDTIDDEFSEAYDDLAKDFLEEEDVPTEEVTEESEDQGESETLEFEDDPQEATEEEESDPAEAEGEESSQDSEAEETEAKAEEEKPEEPEVPKQKTAEELQEEMRASRLALRDKLAEQIQYTEDEVKLLREEPEKVLPKLAADLALDIQDSMMSVIQRTLPQMIANVQRQQEAVRQREQEFFTAWPKLNMQEHGQLIGRLGQTYRQLNPGADAETFIREVGAQAMIAAKIPLSAEMGLVEPQGTPQAKPVKPAKPSAAPSRAPQQLNEFEKLAEEFLQDDDF